MFYRVQPKDVPAPTGTVLAFEGVEYSRVYVDGWYGVDCHIYELTGDCSYKGLENVQTEYHEDEIGEHETLIDVPVYWVTVKTCKIVGSVEAL